MKKTYEIGKLSRNLVLILGACEDFLWSLDRYDTQIALSWMTMRGVQDAHEPRTTILTIYQNFGTNIGVSLFHF